MPVTVDHVPLVAQELGLETVGQLIAHLQKESRMVVQVLIDGQEPDLGQLPSIRQVRLADHVVFVETADPRTLAQEVLDEVVRQLPDAERLKADAADLLQQNLHPKAMEQLGGCIRIWQHAHESVQKVAELLRIDLESVACEGRPLSRFLADFGNQLRQIKSALEQRDFVLLSDTLLYETAQTTQDWLSNVEALRQSIMTSR